MEIIFHISGIGAQNFLPSVLVSSIFRSRAPRDIWCVFCFSSKISTQKIPKSFPWCCPMAISEWVLVVQWKRQYVDAGCIILLIFSLYPLSKIFIAFWRGLLFFPYQIDYTFYITCSSYHVISHFIYIVILCFLIWWHLFLLFWSCIPAIDYWILL